MLQVSLGSLSFQYIFHKCNIKIPSNTSLIMAIISILLTLNCILLILEQRIRPYFATDSRLTGKQKLRTTGKYKLAN